MNDRALTAGENSTGDDESFHAFTCCFPSDTSLVLLSPTFSRNDGVIMGFAVFFFTTMYAIVRYDKSLSGKEPHVNIPVYLLDKAFVWTGLWMMVVAPFAGNLLALDSIYQKW
jgi:hypothetical protein